MVQEARMQTTEAGLVPAGEGWFVVNARDARWVRRPGRGHSAPLTGWTDEEAEGWFHMLGINLVVLGPGEPMAMYHWENDVEAFLVLSGEALLLVEGEERPLRQWDFFHCPLGCAHDIIGAGNGPCVIVAASSRVKMGEPDWGAYAVDPVADKHGVGVETETPDAELAYARFGTPHPVPYPGVLPGD
jgi:uncharacterized cupin superfamily protein